MAQTEYVRIQSRVDTAANWAKNNPTLLDKEIGYVKETGQFKIGDGNKTWNELEFSEPIIKVTADKNPLEGITSVAGERYLIKYENVPYYHIDATANTTERKDDVVTTKRFTDFYVEKIGDGHSNLKELKPLNSFQTGQEIKSGEDIGLNNNISFMESDLYEHSDTNTTVSTALGKGSVAMGRYNRTVGRESAAFNYNNIVLGEQSFATGQSNKINKTAYYPDGGTAPIKYAFVGGQCNEVKAPAQFVIGTYSDVDVNDAFVVGNGSSQDGNKNAFKVDRYGKVYAAQNIETPGAVKATEARISNLLVTKELNVTNSSFFGAGTIGEQKPEEGVNYATGKGSAAFGGNNRVNGNLSFAAISTNTIPETFDHVFIAGHNNTATASFQTIVGSYSDPKTTDAFVVGNGDSEIGLRNAFAVDKNGNIRIGGSSLTLGSTALTEEKLKNILSGDIGGSSMNYYVGSSAPSDPEVGMLWFEV